MSPLQTIHTGEQDATQPTEVHHHHYAAELEEKAKRSSRDIALWTIVLLLLLLFLRSHGWAQDGLTPTGDAAQHVICDSGCGSPPATADGTAFTAGSTNVSPTAAVYNDSLGAVSAGTYNAFRITAYRAVHSNLRDVTGAEIGVVANPLYVNCSVGCSAGGTTPGDAFANPTTAGLTFSFGALWNGATWDRWYGDKTNGGFVNVKTSVLPTGAATASAQTTTNTSLTTISGQLPTLLDGSGYLKTHEQGTATVSGTVTANAGTNLNTSLLALEGGGNLAAIKAKTDNIPAVGQAAMVASTPVVIANNQSSIPVAATLGTETTKVIGTVNVAAGQTIGITANSSVNVAQVNGVTPLMGNGTTGTGSPRVTIASDNTAFTVNLGTTVDLCGPGVVKSYAFYDASTNGYTQVVAASGSTVIRICRYSITSSSTTANTIKLASGDTGGSCANPVAQTPGYPVQAPANVGPAGKTFEGGPVLPAGKAACVSTNAAQAAQVEVSYVQQ